MKPRREVIMISVTDTLAPRTGGEYVYKVMKEEMLMQKYRVREVSVPFLLKRLMKHSNLRTEFEDFYRIILHFRCVFESLLRRCQRRYLVITSSSPAFPVFGHLVYHQPKAGICCRIGREYLSLYEKIALTFHEKEILSPVWLLAKKSHCLHLSNSLFTKELIKKLYGLDSLVLYPPVQISSMLRQSIQNQKFFGIIVARPKAITGITSLPAIVRGLPRGVRFVVIGEADSIGLNVIQNLKRKGVHIDYLGYVDEQVKARLFNTFSHYLHLSLNEPFGITVVEAMAAGCIPIAPRSGGIPEYLPQNLLYDSPSKAAEKIIARVGLEDRYLKMQLRNIAKQFGEEKFRNKFAAHLKVLENLV